MVAVEVRRLAERTTQATKEIGGTIETVQQKTTIAVAEMEAGTHEVELGLSETSKAGAALKKIITADCEGSGGRGEAFGLDFDRGFQIGSRSETTDGALQAGARRRIHCYRSWS